MWFDDIASLGPGEDHMTVSLRLPVPPNIGNSRGHTYYQAFAKKKYFKLCDRYAPVVKIKSAIEFCLFSAHMEVTCLLDCDNLVSRLKWTLDWLRMRGIICADDPRHLWPGSYPTQEIKRGKPQNLFIELRSVKHADLAKRQKRGNHFQSLSQIETDDKEIANHVKQGESENIEEQKEDGRCIEVTPKGIA